MNNRNQKRVSGILVVLALVLFSVSMVITSDNGVWLFGPDSVTAATRKGGGGGGRGRGLPRGTGWGGTNAMNQNQNIPQPSAVSYSNANTIPVYTGPVKTVASQQIYVPAPEAPVSTAGSLEGKAIGRVNDDGVILVLPKDKADPAKEAVKVLTNAETVVVIDAIEAQLDRLKADMQLIITTDSGKAIKIVAFSPVKSK